MTDREALVERIAEAEYNVWYPNGVPRPWGKASTEVKDQYLERSWKVNTPTE